MAYCRLLFVGGRANLNKIYDDCDDSSSESKAEIAFGADWIEDYDWLTNKEKERGRTTDNFTKDNKALYQQILDGYWVYCFDIRDTKKYGDFGWVNIPEQMEENAMYDRDKESRNMQRIIEAIKQLPDDTIFHFADSHW